MNKLRCHSDLEEAALELSLLRTVMIGQTVSSGSYRDLDMACDTHLIATSHDHSARHFGRLFEIDGATLQRVTTLMEAQQFAEDQPRGCIITNCELDDVWVDTAFRWFDGAAKYRPLIIILKDAEQALKYRDRAVHAQDILPICALEDARLRHVLPAALLRYHSVETVYATDRFALSEVP